MSAALLVVVTPATSSPTGASFDPSAASIDIGQALALQSDGRIVVAGFSRRGRRYEGALARYGTRGQLDSSFGTGGLVLMRIGRGPFGVDAIEGQPDGKLVVAGAAALSGDASAFAVGRYTRRGRLDATFGRGGKVLTAFPAPRPATSSSAGVNGVAVQPDGRIVVAGAASFRQAQGIALARYRRTGTLDPNFGHRGTAQTDLGLRGGTYARAVALQRDGRIVVAGFGAPDPDEVGRAMVARFTSRGTLDRSFGTGGWVATPPDGWWSGATAVAIQSDGRIVIAGRVFVPRRGTQLGLIRYLTSGRVDTSFGSNGTVLTNFAVGEEPALAIQPDGKIVVACGLTSPRRFGLGRYRADGSLDPTFGEGGKVRTRFPEGSAARAVAVQADGKIVAAGSSGGDFALARYDAHGTLDESFGAGGLVTTPLGPAWFRRRGMRVPHRGGRD